MRPDLPWNVAGISTEVREAARAAARREGLSVGEWLSRRIESELMEMSDAPANKWNSRSEYRPEPERQRRDSDAMLDRVSKSESETAEVYRRIEDQLRGMARRLDASERSQAESNRVVSKAAVEMNIAAREQTQAFDQLGAHVANLTERLDHVENRDPADGLRDAVKALHQGLSRLADQITQTANQSATQISALAGNLENVAGRVGQARHDSLAATQALESRLAAFDERVRTLEAAAHANAGSIDRALEAIESQRRSAAQPDAILRLEDSVRRLEERSSVDPSLDRRLSGIERTLADVMDRVEPHDEPESVEDSLKKIAQRLDSLESAQREAAAELRRAAQVRSVVETPPPAPVAPPPAITPPAAVAAPAPLASAPMAPPPPPMSAGFSAMPAFEPPPFADVPPFAQPAAAYSAAPSFAEPVVNFEVPPPVEQPFLTPDPVVGNEPAPTVESYLAAARRSARAAAAQETERPTIGGLRWGSATATTASEGSKSRARPLFVGIATLVTIAVIAGAILSRQAASPHPDQVSLIANKPVVAAKTMAPASGALTALHPASPDTPPPAAKLATQSVKPKGSGLMPSGVASVAKPAANSFTPPQATPPQQTQTASRPPASAPLDRLTAAANGGNAKAQLIVGLKYLDGVPANDGEASKWISLAAEAGEPVAQYRLGTLYEQGRGVPTDAAKAARWYLAAANQGNRKAMHNLAVAYAEGAGLKRDYAEASRWFLKAANLGLRDSQFNLAVLYERGLGVPQNLIDAYKWYAIAAAQGDAESKTRLAAITGQLDTDARAAAQHAADAFHPGQLNARANVAPTFGDVTRG